ncbi:uncharacterized protein LOC143218185 [Lasioglossum baleicum]|uniref:uncharacterized protein LOC143218185 n=1 Tax=Lasioglossum baleicum TaxID=434251 RepID=UPI003FCCED77
MANLTEEFIQARLDALLLNWDEFRANHRQLHELSTLCRFLKEISPHVSAPNNETCARGTERHAPAISSVKLRRIDVPTFSGDFKEWPPFKALFTSLVLNNASLDDTERFHYLLQGLQCDALDLVRNLPVDGEHFNGAWQLVDGQFNNTRVLVDNLLETLFSLPMAKSESAAELKKIRGTVKQVLNALTVLKCQVHHWGPFIIFWVTRRLDAESLKAWELLIAKQKEYPEFSVLDDFLQERILALTSYEKVKAAATTTKPRSFSALSHATVSSRAQCTLCSADHYIGICAQYLAMTPEQRMQYITQNRRCFNCLGFHSRNVCRNRGKCMKCASRHHTSLHDAPASSSSVDSTPTTAPPVESSSAAALHVVPVASSVSLRCPIILATALVKVLSNDGSSITARVLLDQGSEVSFVRESICQQLHLPRQHVSLQTYGIGAGHNVTTRGVSTFVISSMTEPFTCKINAFILPTLTHYTPTVATAHASWSHIQGLTLADPSYLESQPIDIVIGVDVYSRIIRPDIRRGADNTPVAQLTKLGWVISGPAASGCSHSASVGVSSFQCGVDRELHELVQRFWVQEEPNTQYDTMLTESERNCEEHFSLTHSRDQTGRYVVRLPFVKNPRELGDSRLAALRILLRTEKALASRPQVREKYIEFLEEYESLGHMRVTTDRENEANTASYILPHHGVFREADFGSRSPPMWRKCTGKFAYMKMINASNESCGAASPHEKIRQLQSILRAGGFTLKKWVANCSELIPADQRSPESANKRTLTIDAPHRALGLAWKTESDAFVFSFQAPAHVHRSKREVLSTISQLFDPLGWLAPVTVQGKLLMQELWMQKTSCDDELPPEFTQRWERFCTDLAEIRELTLDRWVGQLDPDREVEIHGFSDASTRAMGIAIYIRVRDDDETVPRLELSAALLLAKQVAHIRTALGLERIPAHLWTDSAVVLAWIRSPPSKWKDFVRNRVAEIHQLTPHAYWHHVPGTCNPADLASRSVSPRTQLDSIWWREPDWLREGSPAWPTETLYPDSRIDAEKRPEKTPMAHAATSWDLINRFSSLTRLLRITALCFRAVRRMRQKRADRGPADSLTVSELEEARKFWIRQTQANHFMPEIQAITLGVALPKSSSLVHVMPFTDATGILRVGGRPQHSFLDADQKHPMILPRSSALTSLVIAQAHLRNLHAGPQLTLATLRQSYWIVGGRQPIRAFISKCVTCARHRARQCAQIMGQLPSRRITPARAFLHSGVDYAGPFLWRTNRSRGGKVLKGYLAVFVCMTTGAVHLEFVSDYTADAFIAAYKRFTGRRGICSTLSSDCGTNFVGADIELRRMFTRASQESQAIAYSLANLGTQ